MAVRAVSAGDLRAVTRHAPGILRAAGFGERRVAEVTRLAGGSKKGVYRLAGGGGLSVVLYVWSAAEDYWPAEPDGGDAGVFGHASGIGLFEASGRELAAAGVRVPETYLLDRSQAAYPADIAVVEDVRGGTLETLIETDPVAADPVMERLGAMLTPMWERRSARIGKVAEVAAPRASAPAPPPEADSVQIVLDRALRHLARAADRVPEIAGARRRLEDRLRARAALAAPRTGYALVHGELGPDHVLLDGQQMPVVVDIEGAMYFDAEWEHAFLRLRFGRHYKRLARPGLDERRMSLYALALDLSLIDGPLRLLDGGYPDRDPMLAIVGWAIGRALSAASGGNTAHGNS
ncbi:MAG: aminoglycoside phosphotransferase family protein [Trebonia sp.]